MEDLTNRILRKMDQRRRLGWVDYSTGSWDWRVAFARAYRISVRHAGVRLTLQEALHA